MEIFLPFRGFLSGIEGQLSVPRSRGVIYLRARAHFGAVISSITDTIGVVAKDLVIKPMELHFKILSPRTKKVFEWLRHQSFMEQFYLAGGTALALYYGYRTSIDLDFFSIDSFDPDALQEDLVRFGEFDTAKKERNTLTGELEKVKLSFFKIPDKPIRPLLQLDSLRIADILDLALMKIMAIADRGTRRDFVDLYVLAHRFKPLGELLEFLPEKYGAWKYNIAHILRSLGYFVDAEKGRMPYMFEPLDWKTVKIFFHKESERLIKLQIG